MGLHVDLPENEYRAHPGFNASLLKEMRRSAAHAHHSATNNVDKPVFADGRAVHCAVLEPERFSQLYVPAPVVDKRTTAGKQAWADFCAEHEGKEVVSASDFDRYRYIRDAAYEHSGARNLLHLAGYNEASLFGTDPGTGLLVKARFDKLLEGQPLGLDLKTVQDASPEAFAKAAWNFGWHIQDAHYDAVHEAAMGMPLDGFAFIAVEKEPPYQVGLYYLSDEDRRLARLHRDALLAQAGKCRESGIWPGYGDTIQQISLPGWARKQLNETVGEYL